MVKLEWQRTGVAEWSNWGGKSQMLPSSAFRYARHWCLSTATACLLLMCRPSESFKFVKLALILQDPLRTNVHGRVLQCLGQPEARRPSRARKQIRHPGRRT